ncbi:MAG: DNA (cytosine-5-)-methyltransferase [Caldilinea sp. CFX5]|nr:DNA (cytosine-5-)-methyltransferase [Caldilinea sp. CFX5]
MILSTVAYNPTAVDLFSGCGGLTQGLKDAGFKVIGAVEKDILSVQTYKVNHPEVKVWDIDIRSLHPRLLKRQLGLQTGELDLLAGCPPCQGFSSIRTLRGKKAIDDPNNELLFRFLLFVRELKPKAIMLENVPALATDQRLTLFKKLLAELGYTVNNNIVKVLDAADYGVPQRRKRMLLLTGRFGCIQFAKSEERRETVRSAIGNLAPAGQSGDLLHDTLASHTTEVMERIKRIPKDGGSRFALGLEHQLDCHKKTSGFTDIYGRMAWDSISPTITGGCINPSKGRFLHPEEDRAITLREAALLQSFSSTYYISLERGRYPAALLIGNALPPQFIRRHALEVKAYIYNHRLRRFPTDLTEHQWEAVKPLLPLIQEGPGRRRSVSLRDTINGLRFWEATEQSIHRLPPVFPQGTNLMYYYRRWNKSGLWEQIKYQLGSHTLEQNTLPKQLLLDHAANDMDSIFQQG